MDAVTTAIVAAVLSGAQTTEKVEQSSVDATGAVNESYQALKEALVERFDGAPALMQAIRQLEGTDNPRNRQMLHQEVKIMRADQARAVILAADALIEQIQRQPEGDRLLLQARTWQNFS